MWLSLLDKETGYDLYPDYWKQGYMSEAIEKIIEYAKDKMKIKRIFAHIFVDK